MKCGCSSTVQRCFQSKACSARTNLFPASYPSKLTFKDLLNWTNWIFSRYFVTVLISVRSTYARNIICLSAGRKDVFKALSSRSCSLIGSVDIEFDEIQPISNFKFNLKIQSFHLFKRIPQLTNISFAFFDVNGTLTGCIIRARISGILPVSIVPSHRFSANSFKN